MAFGDGGAMLKRLAVIALAAFGAAGCASDRCDEHFKIDSQSPEQYLVATMYVRDCGAFSETVSHVNLREKGEKLSPDARGLISTGEVFAAQGNHTIYLIWKDERHLSIECVGCGAKQVLKKEASWKEVQISYVAR